MLQPVIVKALQVIVATLVISTSPSVLAQTVNIEITGLRSDKGQIVIGVFKNSESYLKEEPYINKIFSKELTQDGAKSVSFGLEPGIYGLCLLDDENGNGKMEYNFLGMPKEGFGFSDYYHSGIKKPKFDSFRFTIKKDETRNITIRIRYIL
ncbi:MAG: DUF2141 domain-containing protein [Bacteroidales bacterium]|nr:DUF2141 domain-containing protein [Bacteroidales bacterium]